jgi:hypothetical protein
MMMDSENVGKNYYDNRRKKLKRKSSCKMPEALGVKTTLDADLNSIKRTTITSWKFSTHSGQTPISRNEVKFRIFGLI